MSEFFWKKFSSLTGLAVMTALFGCIFIFSSIYIYGSDIWLHLAAGKFIIHNGYVPKHDIFSFYLNGKPWLDHEWLFQVISYAIYHIKGFTGIVYCRMLLILGFFASLLLFGSKKENLSIINLFVIVLVFLTFRIRWIFRPELFSLLFFSLYLYFLKNKLHLTFLLPVIFVMQVLWTNIHGFFFLGPLLVLVLIISDIIKKYVTLPYKWNKTNSLSSDDFKLLCKILFVVLLACFINPNTYKGALYPFSVLLGINRDSSLILKHIIEMQSPIKWSTVFYLRVFPYYKILIVISIISFFLNRKNIDISDLFIWIILFIFSVSTARNIVFFSFIAFYVITYNFSKYFSRKKEKVDIIGKKDKYLLAVIAKIMLIILLCYLFKDKVMLSSSVIFGHKGMRLDRSVSHKSFAKNAVDFLNANKIKGNFYNDFNSGSYMIGRCYPAIKVFIDGRTELYGKTAYKIYKDINNGNKKLFDALDFKYNITGVMLSSVTHGSIPKGILRNLYKDKKWKIVYFDYDGIIFLKDIPANKECIYNNSIDLKSRIPGKFGGIIKPVIMADPSRFLAIADVLDAVGLFKQALMEMKQALIIFPSSDKIYVKIGNIYFHKKKYKKAEGFLKKAIRLGSMDAEARYGLAVIYHELGDNNRSILECYEAIKLNPLHKNSYFYLAHLLTQKGKYDDAFFILKKAYSMDPYNLDDLISMGDYLYAKKEFLRSMVVFNMALSNHRDNKFLLRKVNMCKKQLGL